MVARLRVFALAVVLAASAPTCSTLPGHCEVQITDRAVPVPEGRRGETLLVAGVKLGGVIVYEVRSPGEGSRVAALGPDDLGGSTDRVWLAADASRPYVVSPAGHVVAVNPFTGRSSTIAELGVLESPSVAADAGVVFVVDAAKLFQVAVPAGLPVVVTGLPGKATGPAVALSGGVAVLVRRSAGAAVAFVPRGTTSAAHTTPLPGEPSAWSALVRDPSGDGVVAGGPRSLARIDRATLASPATVLAGSSPSPVAGADAPGEHLARAGDRLWSGGPAGRVNRIGAAALSVDSATTVACDDDQIPEPVDGAGSVWASVDRDDVVGRIDPETGKLLARLSIPLPEPGESARYKVMGGRATAWVIDEANGAVYELDPLLNQARAVPLPGPPEAIVDAVVVDLPEP